MITWSVDINAEPHEIRLGSHSGAPPPESPRPLRAEPTTRRDADADS